MKAAKIIQPGHLEIVELPIPEPARDEVVVKVMASGICGTDIHIYRGEYLGDYPVIPGHEFSGVIESVGEAVTRFKVGDRVAVEPNISCDNCYNCLNNRQNFCLNWQAVGVTRPGGMAQCVAVPEKAVFDVTGIPFEQAAFMEPLSCVLHGMGRLGIEASDKVAILGAGPIGILLLQVARLQGAAEITVVDKNISRSEFAKSTGADISLTAIEDLQRDTYDVVIDGTGAIPVMARTLDFVRHGGKVLLFGVPPGGQMMDIEPFVIFRKGLTVLSSFTSLRNSYQAIDLFRYNRIDINGLVSHQLPLQELQEGIELIEGGQPGVRKVLIRPND